MTGCAISTNAGICEALERQTKDTKSALLNNDVSDRVGEPTTDLIVGLYAACKY
mgnify:FL=1